MERDSFGSVSKMGIWEQESLQRYKRFQKKLITTNKTYGSFYIVDQKRTRKMVIAVKHMKQKQMRKTAKEMKKSVRMNEKYEEDVGESTCMKNDLSIQDDYDKVPSELFDKKDSDVAVTMVTRTKCLSPDDMKRMSISPDSGIVQEPDMAKYKYGWVRALAMPSSLPREFTFGIPTRPEQHKIPLLSWEHTPPSTPKMKQRCKTWAGGDVNGLEKPAEKTSSPLQVTIRTLPITAPAVRKTPSKMHRATTVSTTHQIGLHVDKMLEKNPKSDTKIPLLPPINNDSYEREVKSRKSQEILSN